MEHGGNKFCEVEPKTRYINGHVLRSLQDLFQPAGTRQIIRLFWDVTILKSGFKVLLRNTHPLKYCCDSSSPAFTSWCSSRAMLSLAFALRSSVDSTPCRTNTYSNEALLSSVTHCNASCESRKRHGVFRVLVCSGNLQPFFACTDNLSN